MKALEIISVVKANLSVGYAVQEKSNCKIFAVRRSMPKSDALATIQRLVVLVNNLTAEHQMNHGRSKKINWAYLNEAGTMCSGFSFEVR